tara:strand:- start:4526 stop:5515 length:990 start_codon:yes stop_codon:yes gene_type:complete
MTAKAKDNILTIAKEFELSEGINEDFYNFKGHWCLTKNGAQKIRNKMEIVYHSDSCDISNVSVAYRATFECKKTNVSVRAVGGCRLDVTQNNPQRTHPHEMAWKRMEVRGTILCLGALGMGIYGDDEFDADYGGKVIEHAPRQTNHTSPQPQTLATNADKTIDWSKDPRVPPKGTQGWWETAHELPKEWSEVMADFCDYTSLPRAEYETQLIDHCGKFQFDDGNWWKPSAKYSDFASYAFAVENGKSKAGGALNLLKSFRKFMSDFKARGSIEIQVPNREGSLVAVEIKSKGLRQAEADTEPIPEEVQTTTDAVVQDPPKTRYDHEVPF